MDGVRPAQARGYRGAEPRRTSRRGFPATHSVHSCRSLCESANAAAHNDRVPDVYHDNIRVVGHFKLGAGVRVLSCCHARASCSAMGKSCRHVLQPGCGMRIHRLRLLCGINGAFSLGQYTWCPTWLPEVYPTRIRATAVSFCFNAPRFIAFLGPLAAGTLITYFGGYGRAAVIVSMIYVLGLVAAPFFPETRGKMLPD